MALGFELNKQENKQETLNKWRGELTKGRNVQLPALYVYWQRGARGVRGVRGAVFRDIEVLGIGKMCLVRYILLISIKKRNRLRFSCISDLHVVTLAAYSV